MELRAGKARIPVLAAIEARHPYKGSMADTLQLVMETLPSAAELKAIRENNIDAEDGRIFGGYTGLISVSVMLYREDEIISQREAEEKEAAAFLELLEAAPDEVARKHAARFPGMRYDSRVIKKGTRINWNGKLMRILGDLPDSPDNTPANRPDAWEEVS